MSDGIRRWAMDGHGNDVKPELDPDGDWVFAHDHEAELARLNARTERAEQFADYHRRQEGDLKQQIADLTKDRVSVDREDLDALLYGVKDSPEWRKAYTRLRRAALSDGGEA